MNAKVVLTLVDLLGFRRRRVASELIDGRRGDQPFAVVQLFCVV